MAKYYELEAEDFLARAIQHEIDHLHGVLFTSKVTRYITAEELEGYEGQNDERLFLWEHLIFQCLY